MKIHNFYSDLLRSLIFLFNNYVYDKNTIKQYTFNIANRSFQFKYDTQFNLPSMIISLDSSTPINLHPTNIQHIGLGNINRIPVLYNRTKDLTIELQEEHYIINIPIIINCESQIQSKNLEFQLQSSLPLNKWMHAYTFTSFIEIDEDIFNKDIIQLDYHDMVNLFKIYDYDQAKSIKSFAVHYNPLIRLSSTSSSISSVEQRTFTVNCNLELMVQFPQYLHIPFEQRPQSREERFFSRDNVIIDVTEDDTQLLYFELINSSLNLPDFAVIEYNTSILNQSFNNEINILSFNSTITSNITTAKFEWISNKNFNPDIILNTSNNVIISRDILNNNNINWVKTEGPLTGIIHTISEDYNENRISGVFEGTYYDEYIKDKLDFKYSNQFTQTSISYSSPPNIPGYSTKAIKILPKTPYILSTISRLNQNKVDVLIEKSKLKSFIYKDLQTNQIINLPINQFFDPIHNNIVHSLFAVHYDNNIRKLQTTFNHDPSLIKPLAFNFYLSFHSKPSYGGSYIERINIELFTNESPITIIPIVDLVDNLETSPIKENINPNAIYIIPTIDFQEDNLDYHLLSVNTEFSSLPSSFNFIIKNSKFSLHNSNSNFTIDSIQNSTINFKINKEYFFKTFIAVSPIDPLFFHIYF